MYIININETKLPFQDNLIIDYNLLVPSNLLTKYYFYLKIFYILLIVGFYLCLIFSPHPPLGTDVDNTNSSNLATPIKQSTLSNFNRLIKDYAGIFIMFGTLYTGHIQYKTAISQEEVAKYKESEKTLKARVERLEETIDEANKKLSYANNVTGEVEVKLEKANTIANNLRVDMEEFKKSSIEMSRLKIVFSNEEDPYKKTKISAEIDALGVEINRRFQGNIDGLDKATSEIKDTVAIIKATMSSVDNNNSSNAEGSSNPTVSATSTNNKNEGVIIETDIKKSSIIDLDLLRE